MPADFPCRQRQWADPFVERPLQTEQSQSRPASRKAAGVDTCHSKCAVFYDRFTFEFGFSAIGGCDAS
jgi:hypothetical protein